MKRWRSVRNWISGSRFSVIVTSIAGLAVITILFLLSYIISTKAERVVVEAFSEEGLGMVRGASRRVEHLFKGINSELEQLSMLRELQVPDDIQGSGIMEVTYQGMMNYVSCLRRLDKKGDLIIGYQGDCELIEEAASEFNKGYFQKTMRENTSTVSKAFINEEGQRRIRVTYPIYREGKGGESIFDGVLSAVVKVDAIYSMMVSPFKPIEEEGMRFVLYSSEGEIFSFPTHSDIEGKNIFNDLEYCGGCHTVPEEFILLSQRGEGWDIVNSFPDKKVVALYQPVELPDKSLLIVGLYADYNNVVKEGREISKYAVLVAAFSVLIVMVGSVITLTLLKVRDEAERREKAIEHERELMRRVKESEERYRDLFEGVENGVYVSTPEGHFKEVNSAMIQMFGYENKEEILRVDIGTALYFDPRDRVSFTEEVEKRGVIKDFETRLKKKSGDPIICLETSYGRMDESGKIIEYLGVMVDITRRKEMEAALKESRRRLRELYEAAGEAIFVEDLDGNILDVNRKAIEIFGYTREEFLQLNAVDLLPSEVTDEFDRFKEILEREGSFKVETRNRLKDGTFIDADVNAKAVMVGKEKLIQVFVRDISEVKRKEKEIHDTNSELNTLHEVSMIINRSLDLDEILNISLEKTLEVTPFEAGAVHLYDERTQILNLAAFNGMPEEMFGGKLDSIRLGETLTGKIAQDKEMILLDSLSSDSRSITAKLGLNFQAYAGLPLLYGDRLMGVMNLTTFNKLPREEYRVEFLKGISELIGIAIGNGRLYSDVQQRATEMQVLYEAGKAFMAITEIDQLARKVVEVANTELGYEACSLFLLDEGKETLSILDASYLQKGEKRQQSLRVGLDGVVGWVAENKELCSLPDVTEDPRYLPGWLDKGAELAIPLMVGEEILGVIDFEMVETNGFRPGGIRYMSLFANQVAWALYNVKLFEEIKKANDDMNRVSELKTQFVSFVSHELRTPMTAIKGSLDIIHSGAAGPVQEKTGMFISMARRNIDRLNDMVNNILDLSRIEAGKIEFEFREVDIQEPLKHVMLTMSASADEKTIVLESHLPSELPTLYADEAKVEQVLTNLIGNALKHTPSGGKVTIVAGMARDQDLSRIQDGEGEGKPPKNFFKVSVIDTGTGIPEDQLDTIFDSYKQLSGEKGDQGTGLGLAICRYLVEEHGGAIWAERGSGVGSVLNFLLPVYRGEKPTHVNKQGSMALEED